MSLRRAWEDEAPAWTDFARSAAADPVFHSLNLPHFMAIVPEAGRLTVDVGCGEGRVARALQERGHDVIGVDVVHHLVAAASDHATSTRALVADGAALPIADAVADIVVLFMVLHDVDDPAGVVKEAARILVPGGRLCVAMTHPIQGIGAFAGEPCGLPYVVDRPYFAEKRLTYWAERDGHRVALSFVHRPLSAYMKALEESGFLVEALREPRPEDASPLDDRAQRRAVPSLLHIRAIKG